MLRTTRFVKLIPIVVAAACTAGCGPFGYLKKVAKESTRAVADAEAAGAEENAPYEYWGSVTYLEQSKILMGYSEYERSFDYGERAKQLAEEAKKKAEMRRKGQMDQRAEGVATPDEVPAGTPTDGKAAGDGTASGSTGAGGAKGEVKAGVSVGGGK
ncbi:hypothetical protein SAMN02745121_07820 [Nannocystis exedens]|uniref:Uncharacterized protein n=1 Tax=Nannocystis exedens TaxID=54 RepID=A0A1I2HB06_9BACT|nr:DUF4398 domain-containing protein [Nannocystis exedens]PCC70049.1 hypothetical protein NAEX_03082 [Nannocystis exedens]SFF26563.1 hypothetical protein SAMN02745121_07820 [Nannocystis exedens]